MEEAENGVPRGNLLELSEGWRAPARDWTIEVIENDVVISSDTAAPFTRFYDRGRGFEIALVVEAVMIDHLLRFDCSNVQERPRVDPARMLALVQIIAQISLTTATTLSAASGNMSSLSHNSKILLSSAAASTAAGFLACLSVIGLSGRGSSSLPAQVMLRIGCFASAFGFLASMAMLLPDHLKLWTAGFASMACLLIAISPAFLK